MENCEDMHTSKKREQGRHQVTYVEVRDGPPWIDGPSNHLENLVRSDSATHPCKKECREWRNNRTGDERYNVRPNGKRRLSMEHTDKTFVAPKMTSGVRLATSGRSQVLTSEEC
jgi:hypothetical protein